MVVVSWILERLGAGKYWLLNDLLCVGIKNLCDTAAIKQNR